MDYEDHFTSHSFRSLYWISFEKCLDSMDPSQSVPPGKDVQNTVETVNDEEPSDKNCRRDQKPCDLTRNSSDDSIMRVPEEDDSSSDEEMESDSEDEELETPNDDCVPLCSTDGSDTAVDDDEGNSFCE
ncbi:hypothetical protein EV421DRAFT_1739206 [Armillaria borealis]|uniref:Uncharacterized protein n=1 Tax=Armillaria borealis TaxID=47425 RepID=A0AA39J720_9AGAR|nr:hypothetical protein EV421DRAFT_1739206 [Armillaria borealis]